MVHYFLLSAMTWASFSSDLAWTKDWWRLHSVQEITVRLLFRGVFFGWVSAMVSSAAAPFVSTLRASVGGLSSELGDDMGGLTEGVGKVGRSGLKELRWGLVKVRLRVRLPSNRTSTQSLGIETTANWTGLVCNQEARRAARDVL